MPIRTLFGLLILFTSVAAWANSAASRGCVAIFQGTTPVSIEVDLPVFEGGLFQTKQFFFANLPENMRPDEKGRFCYPMDDERFAFVHVYYYAVKEIEDYNRIFLKLGLPLGKMLKETVVKDNSFPTGGRTDLTEGRISHPDTPPDPSVIQHEIGHWVRDNAAGRVNEVGDVLAQSSADFIAVLHSGNTSIGKYDTPVLYNDINTFIQFPDHLVTRRRFYEKGVQDPVLATKYPRPYEELKAILKKAETNPDLAKYLNNPDPDVNASAINQPLWQAAMFYGVDTVKLIYIKMLAAFNEDRDYSIVDVAQMLIYNANEINPELGAYLKKEFTFRGIFNIEPTQHIIANK